MARDPDPEGTPVVPLLQDQTKEQLIETSHVHSRTQTQGKYFFVAYNLQPLSMRGGPGEPICAFAGSDKARNLPRCQIDFGYLVAADAGDIGYLAVGANQNLLRRLAAATERATRMVLRSMTATLFLFGIASRSQRPSVVGALP